MDLFLSPQGKPSAVFAKQCPVPEEPSRRERYSAVGLDHPGCFLSPIPAPQPHKCSLPSLRGLIILLPKSKEAEIALPVWCGEGSALSLLTDSRFPVAHQGLETLIAGARPGCP